MGNWMHTRLLEGLEELECRGHHCVTERHGTPMVRKLLHSSKLPPQPPFNTHRLDTGNVDASLSNYTKVTLFAKAFLFFILSRCIDLMELNMLQESREDASLGHSNVSS